MGNLKMNLYITRKYDGLNNAGGKAPSDVNAICHNLGWTKFEIRTPKNNKKLNKAFYMVPYLWHFLKITKVQGDYVLYQHPSYYSMKVDSIVIRIIKKVSNFRIVMLVHDLDSLRFRTARSEKEMGLLEASDYIICHNHRMKEYLVSKGIVPEKFVELEIFDYLCEKESEANQNNPEKNSVAIAGNLSPEKCSYIYKFIENNPELKINLYGVGYKGKSEYTNAEYHGSFSPEELPSKLDSAYGLVWDGPEITSCSGDFGEYLRFNNPHKLSLYMAAGIPVVTWKQAAIADFVEKHQVGIVVDSLVDLSKTLDQISEEQYAAMKTNAEAIGEKLREGFYFRRALQEIFDMDASKNETRSMAE